jgi:hypothetical protein
MDTDKDPKEKLTDPQHWEAPSIYLAPFFKRCAEGVRVQEIELSWYLEA